MTDRIALVHFLLRIAVILAAASSISPLAGGSGYDREQAPAHGTQDVRDAFSIPQEKMYVTAGGAGLHCPQAGSCADVGIAGQRSEVDLPARATLTRGKDCCERAHGKAHLPETPPPRLC